MVEPSSKIHYASANSDKSVLVYATSSGYCIYSTLPLSLRVEDRAFGGMKIAEMLDNTSLIALVCSGETPGSSPRNLRLLAGNTRDSICEMPFHSAIEALRVSKSKLLVCLENSMLMYDLSSMQFLQDFSTLDADTARFSAVAMTDDLLAFSTRATAGEIIVFDTTIMRQRHSLACHRSAVSHVTLSSDSSLMATASVTGTIFRIFSTETGKIQYSYRRGTISTGIKTLSFSPNSQYLLAGSDTGTVHIFTIGDRGKGGREEYSSGKEERQIESDSSISLLTPISLFHSVSKVIADVAASTAALIEASGISDDSVRATYTVKIPEESESYISFMIHPDNASFKLIVATYEGFIYKYGVNNCEQELILEDCDYVSF